MKISKQQISKMYLMFNDLLGYKHIREYVGQKKNRRNGLLNVRNN